METETTPNRTESPGIAVVRAAPARAAVPPRVRDRLRRFVETPDGEIDPARLAALREVIDEFAR